MNSSVIRNIDAMPLQPGGMGSCHVEQSFKFVLPSIGNNHRRSFFQKRYAYRPPQSACTSSHHRQLSRICFAHCHLHFEEIDASCTTR